MKNIFLILLFCLHSCSLFRKTSKTTNNTSQSSVKQVESTELILKSAFKETKIFTYGNDSGFYQFQHIKEHVDQSKQGKLNAQESQHARQLIKLKTIEPANYIIYIGIVILLALIFLFLFKNFRFLNLWHNK